MKYFTFIILILLLGVSTSAQEKGKVVGTKAVLTFKGHTRCHN